MSLGKRRPRFPRALTRPRETTPLQHGRLARQRRRLVRLAVVALSIIAAAAIVYGDGPPFVYRLGQRVERDIRVKVGKFERRNQIKTNTRRQLEADRVPPIMVNDPTRIRDLGDALDDLIDAVAQAPNLEALPASSRSVWRLTERTFDQIKAAGDTPERREALHRQIGLAFASIARDGVLGPDSLPRGEELRDVLAVGMKDDPAGTTHPVPRERVVRERVVKTDGPVYQEFTRAIASPGLGPILFGLIAERLAGTPTLTFEARATTQARERARVAVGDEVDVYNKGDMLVEQGQEIGEEQLILLRREHEVAKLLAPRSDVYRRAASILVLVASLFALIGYYVYRHEPRIASDIGRTTGVCALVVAAIGVVRLLSLQPWDAELIPIAVAAMVLAIAYNPHFALMVTFALSLLSAVALGTGIGEFIINMGGTAAGVLTLNEVRTRTKLIKVGATAALGYFVLTWAVGLWGNEPLNLILSESLWRSGWGLMAGFFLGRSLPFIETAFGMVTGISLLELGDATHPLLQELVRRAPGTHNHSIAVGSVAESAAERIGADALLVRIGAYFHDIGKMMKPHYFVENQAGGSSRHANLAPTMSTLIIIGHVKDGVDLARRHHLPAPIIDLIEQHHGTTLVEYFYHEANRRSDGNPDAPAVVESAFRYPGPKPRSREAAVLMVADAVESASRALSEPTPARIESLVREIVEKRLRDGQFDECGLTLRDIAEVRDSLVKSLIGIHHGRIKYPEQRTA